MLRDVARGGDVTCCPGTSLGAAAKAKAKAKAAEAGEQLSGPLAS